MLYRGEHCLIADLGYDGRCAVVATLSDAWMTPHAGELMRAFPGKSAVEAITISGRSDLCSLG